MMWGDSYSMGAWMGAGWWWMILATVGVVLLIVWAVRGLGSAGSGQPPHHERGGQAAALDALNLRFAKGEISEEEYQRMRRTLQS